MYNGALANNIIGKTLVNIIQMKQAKPNGTKYKEKGPDLAMALNFKNGERHKVRKLEARGRDLLIELQSGTGK